MLFASDNCAGVAPEISQALARHADGMAHAYGKGDLDREMEARLAELFETEASVFFVGTGTAANSLAAAGVMKPGGMVFCHSEAHVQVSEAGAPEFLSGGGRLVPISGPLGKIDPQKLDRAAMQTPRDFNHLGQGVMATITQASEAGTVYSLEEIAAIGEISAKHGLALHMDGARFANALVKLDCTPAEMTWKRGVDMVSFGATKNGCWCAEALVVFNRDLSSHFQFLRKRAGHLFSKTRFISAQFEAYLEDGLWLDLARHSNSIGKELEATVRDSNRARLAWPSDSNQVFFITDQTHAEQMKSKGATFHAFPTPKGMEEDIGENEQVYRLVGAFSSTSDDVKQFADLLAG
ncbi:MAG: low specificity L-threonine aldolase [Rhizobiaceae bacterium]|nr:low specificity L-threonine aldolase [Rhizobiaceae bacterium]